MKDRIIIRTNGLKEKIKKTEIKGIKNFSEKTRILLELGLNEKKIIEFEKIDELKIELSKLSDSLRRVGINLNQIARFLNQGDSMSSHSISKELNDVLKVQKDIFKKIEEIKEFLNL